MLLITSRQSKVKSAIVWLGRRLNKRPHIVSFLHTACLLVSRVLLIILDSLLHIVGVVHKTRSPTRKKALGPQTSRPSMLSKPSISNPRLEFSPGLSDNGVTIPFQPWQLQASSLSDIKNTI